MLFNLHFPRSVGGSVVGGEASEVIGGTGRKTARLGEEGSTTAYRRVAVQYKLAHETKSHGEGEAIEGNMHRYSQTMRCK